VITASAVAQNNVFWKNGELDLLYDGTETLQSIIAKINTIYEIYDLNKLAKLHQNQLMLSSHT
jgi:hypothetical protein